MVELRKRPPPATTAAPPAKKAATTKAQATKAAKAATTKAAPSRAKAATTATAKSTDEKPDETTSKTKAASGPPKEGDTLSLTNLGGEVQLNDGTSTTLSKLVDDSKNGVVIFTYPKASTPGCTKQACLFRDAHTSIEATGYSVYGLSADSPKANTTFQTKQSLPYPLLCDPQGTLIKALSFKKAGPGSGTARGVVVLDKDGKVLLWMLGSPNGTFETAKKTVKA